MTEPSARRATAEQREDLRVMDEKERSLERRLAMIRERRREYINQNDLNK